MSTTHARIVEICALLLAVFISGFWLAKTGRPFQGLPMNLHKFASLAAVVLLIMLVVHTNRLTHLGGLQWIACAIAVVTLLGAVVSGGVVAAQEPAPVAGVVTHRIALFLAAISNAAAMWLVWKRV